MLASNHQMMTHVIPKISPKTNTWPVQLILVFTLYTFARKETRTTEKAIRSSRRPLFPSTVFNKNNRFYHCSPQTREFEVVKKLHFYC
ncbi:hypothetical protein SO802_010769 [Lithocarpus litseifolius]|uniref:Uncharacterized protein n=1 Tax=Lithocarpus litseifolius TaxID=425828 RepID=A0AAW2DFN2_9ROSI